MAKKKPNTTILTEDLFNAAGNATVTSDAEVLNESTEETTDEVTDDTVDETISDIDESIVEEDVTEDEVVNTEDKEIVSSEDEVADSTDNDISESNEEVVNPEESVSLEEPAIKESENISEPVVVHNGYSDDDLYEN